MDIICAKTGHHFTTSEQARECGRNCVTKCPYGNTSDYKSPPVFIPKQENIVEEKVSVKVEWTYETMLATAKAAGFNSIPEYVGACRAIELKREQQQIKLAELEAKSKELDEREAKAEERKRKLDSGEYLLELQKQCDDKFEDIKKEYNQIIKDTKQSIADKNKNDYKDMDWALGRLNDITLTMREWGFYDYSSEVINSMNWIGGRMDDGHNVADILPDFKSLVNKICGFMEKTQTMKKGAEKLCDMRNQIGKVVSEIQVTLGIDDRRNGSGDISAQNNIPFTIK